MVRDTGVFVCVFLDLPFIYLSLYFRHAVSVSYTFTLA